ncbi:MAG: hypothetical protein MUE81_04995 [Thermoflexibacter sp.]|jgi:hypothetical protein|nr:hypothetical protein [Thermoflexibacter sp.]
MLNIPIEVHEKFIKRQVAQKTKIWDFFLIFLALFAIIFTSMALSLDVTVTPNVSEFQANRNQTTRYVWLLMGIIFGLIAVVCFIYSRLLASKERKVLEFILKNGDVITLQIKNVKRNYSYTINKMPQYIYEIYDEKGEFFELKTFNHHLVNVLSSISFGQFEALHSTQYPDRIIPLALIEYLGKSQEQEKKKGKKLSV